MSRTQIENLYLDRVTIKDSIYKATSTKTGKNRKHTKSYDQVGTKLPEGSFWGTFLNVTLLVNLIYFINKTNIRKG